MRAILLVVTLSVLGAVGSDRGRSPALARHSRIERLHWLAGCWERVSGERTIEEQWMRPRGRSMLGMGRTVRGDSTVEYELMRRQGVRRALSVSTRGVRVMTRKPTPPGALAIA